MDQEHDEAFYLRARVIGGIFAGSLAVAVGYDIGGKGGIYVAAVGGFFGICIGENLSAVFAYFLPNFENAENVCGFYGGLIAAVIAARVGISVAKEFDPNFVY
uniref:Uncharacterized protein n=1 Tax=Panagrolaimus sp. ES5 TaxID=591445 RepID=A0AC34F772_9BILA